VEGLAARPATPHDRRLVGIDEREVVMRKFVAKHATQVAGTLSCFDRLLCKGHLPLGYPQAMEQFLTQRRVLTRGRLPLA
jgi:hypothetical protein